MMSTDQSLSKLFSKRAWYKNSGIKESTARVYKKRFLENKLELETRIKILRACGFKLAQDMGWEERSNPDSAKIQLADKLLSLNAFWSFNTHKDSGIPDEILIEKVLLHLDIDDITRLFLLFPRPLIKKVWKNKILRQEPMYHSLNRLYAFLYFDIGNPDRYIGDFVLKRNKSIKCKD